MDDLITRQVAIEEIEEYADRLQMVDWKENPWIVYKVNTLNWCVNMIRDLPSAQPERAMGKWMDTDNYYQRWKCSVCGCHTRDAKPPYCPHCGKKMEV